MRLKRLKIVRKKNGKRYLFYRAPGGALTGLPDLPFDDPKFLMAYANAKREGEGKEPKPSKKRLEGSLTAIADAYYRSITFQDLAPSSKATRRSHVNRIVKKGPNVHLSAIKRRHVQKDIDDCPRGSASGRLNAWRALFKMAVRLDWDVEDPTGKIELPKHKGTPHMAWTTVDIQRFRERWPLGTEQRLAFELLYWTGCRRADAARLGWQHVSDGRIAFRTSKTGQLVDLPIAEKLLDALALVPRDRMTFFQMKNGRARTPHSFGIWFAAACVKAGVEARTHGIRHKFGGDTAEAGIESSAAAAALAHSSNQQAHYRKQADRRRLSDEAIKRLEQERNLETAKLESWKPER